MSKFCKYDNPLTFLVGRIPAYANSVLEKPDAKFPWGKHSRNLVLTYDVRVTNRFAEEMEWNVLNFDFMNFEKGNGVKA